MVAIGCAATIFACNREPRGSGDACTRSSECDDGLACVEGSCSASLSGIGDPGAVPMLTEQAPPVEEGRDAAMMMGEAGASGDASIVAIDAAVPDAGL